VRGLAATRSSNGPGEVLPAMRGQVTVHGPLSATRERGGHTRFRGDGCALHGGSNSAACEVHGGVRWHAAARLIHSGVRQRARLVQASSARVVACAHGI
jgi:hypothetical protein